MLDEWEFEFYVWLCFRLWLVFEEGWKWWEYVGWLIYYLCFGVVVWMFEMYYYG